LHANEYRPNIRPSYLNTFTRNVYCTSDVIVVKRERRAERQIQTHDQWPEVYQQTAVYGGMRYGASCAPSQSTSNSDHCLEIAETPLCSDHEMPPDSVYDDIDDVIPAEDEDTAADSQESVYDGLQESTRDPVIQAPSVYEKIRSDIATAATNSGVTTHKYRHKHGTW